MTAGDDFARFELEGWERVASLYEATWSTLTRPFIPHLLDDAGVVPDMRVLDVACGPGFVTEAVRELGAQPVGVDFSPEMIRLAQARNPDLMFRVGDAQSLDLEDGSFDAVVMNFGVLHLSKPDQAFAEAARVLRPGGSFGFTTWASPELSEGARVIEEAIEAHATTDGAIPEGPEYFAYGDAESCRTALGRVGFDPATLSFRTVTVDWHVPDASFVFAAERDAGVRAAARLAAQEPAILRAIELELARALEPFATEDGLRIPFAGHVIAARLGD